MTAPVPDVLERGRVPCLDGLRAIAIGLVILSHLGAEGRWAMALGWGGHLGVTLFFVISGFLVTLLLLREHEANGRISLRGFYARRVLRIFPAYYAYLAVGLVLAAAGVVSIGWKYWVAAATYVMCYVPDLKDVWHIGHFWSLAVEEHFYLLWPLALIGLTPARAWKVALAYLCAAPFLRYGVWSLHRDWLDIDFCSLTQMSSIAAGCLLAFAMRNQALPGLGAWIRARPGRSAALGVAIVIVSRVCDRSGRYAIALGDPVNAVACCLIIGGLPLLKTGWARALFDNRSISFIGVLSYSLYLWQQPFVPRGLLGEGTPQVVRVGALLLAAVLSHYVVEKPFLRLKERLRSSKRPAVRIAPVALPGA